MTASLKFFAWSCPHCPIQDKDTHKWMLEEVRRLKPDYLVMLGDLLEADAASVHGENETADWDLDGELTEAAAYLNSFREAAGPDCDFVKLDGNHCDNIKQKNPKRIPKKLRSLCVPERHHLLGPELEWWKVIEYRHDQTYRLGPVTFRHGCEAGASADRDQAVLYGVPHGLTIAGHTHRGRDVERAMLTRKVPLDYYFANAGCSVDWDKLGYMDRLSKAMWTHGYVAGEVSATAVKHRQTLFASPQWDARHVVLKRAR